MNPAFSVKKLRLSSHIAEAMKMASEALGKTPADFVLMGETIRVLVLARQPEAASSLFQVFSSADSKNNLEPEVLVRLALMMDRADLIKDMPPPAGPSWLVEMLTNGQDLVGFLNPTTMDIKVANGPAHFNFQGPCPHCRHLLGAQVKVSLLINRSWICPSCFGNVELDHQGARNCLNEQFSPELQESATESDADLIDYLRPKLMGAEPMPDIALALGQEYHFLLNELMLDHLNAEGNSGEAGS